MGTEESKEKPKSNKSNIDRGNGMPDSAAAEEPKKKSKPRKGSSKDAEKVESRAKPGSTSRPKQKKSTQDRTAVGDSDDASSRAALRFENLTFETFLAMEKTITLLKKGKQEQAKTNNSPKLNEPPASAAASSDAIIEQLKAQITRLEEEKEALQNHKSTLKDRIEILQEDKKDLQAEKKALKIKVASIMNSAFSSLQSATSRVGAPKRAKSQASAQGVPKLQGWRLKKKT